MYNSNVCMYVCMNLELFEGYRDDDAERKDGAGWVHLDVIIPWLECPV